MQPGGFGGQGPGQPPGGYPPGFPPGGAPPYGGQPAGGHPQAPQQGTPQFPGAPAQQYGAPAAAQYGAPPQQYGAPAAAQYGAPPQQYGAPGMPAAYPGAMPGAMPGAYPGAGAMGMGAAPHNSFGQAQSALSGAGSMMKLMKYAFLGIGALCIVGGVIVIIAADFMTGIMVAVTGAIFIGVALAVLPQFSGMVSQASAMVDGFAAKEQLAQTGIPAQGRLISVQQTGRLVNYNPEIQALVEVTHPQLGVYQTQTTAIVPQIAIPRAQPGAPVQVRVSPQNQHEIALVF